VAVNLEKVVSNLVRRIERRFYGKYRALVVDNADPEQLGRLKLQIPSVLGTEVVTGWAMPCVPYGGDVDQGFLFIPEVGAGVWVEFEEGDLEFPIWVGNFWSKPGGESELPKPNIPEGSEQGSVQDPPTRKIIKTKAGHSIQFEDAEGEEMILVVEAVNGHVVTLDSNGIKIKDGANSDQELVFDSSGITVSDKNGNKIILASDGIKVGSDLSSEHFVLGTQFLTNITNFLVLLNTHTHVGNLGAPTSPPVTPMQLQVPLSARHTVE
jgi:uncharacterized protein involved in type VI secretion and phage assembly